MATSIIPKAPVVSSNYYFSGEIDSDRCIVSNLPLTHTPLAITGLSRYGWTYDFMYWPAKSSSYWTIRVASETASGTYAGRIVALLN